MTPYQRHFANLDKQWLSKIILDKENHVKDVNGALVSEVVSDLFVLASGGLTVAFAIASGAFPLIGLLPLVQLGLAYKAIDSLYDQKKKVDNDLHVLKAILQVDEETPENITAMLRDYISIHAEPDQDKPLQGVEVKKLSPEALMTVQKNFRQKKERLSVFQKVGVGAAFLKSEFKNAAFMVVKTVLSPRKLARSVASGSRDLARIYSKWDDVKRNMNADTLRETYKYTLSRAHKGGDHDALPKDAGGLFSDERKNQLYYLHQQQASLRTVARQRVETAQGVVACSVIIALAVAGAVMSAGALAIVGNIYTIVASLPSLKVLNDELSSLTKTSDIHSPKVNHAAADFLIGMPVLSK